MDSARIVEDVKARFLQKLRDRKCQSLSVISFPQPVFGKFQKLKTGSASESKTTFRGAATAVRVVISVQNALRRQTSHRRPELWSRVETQAVLERRLSSVLEFLPSYNSRTEVPRPTTLQRLLSLHPSKRTSHEDEILKYIRRLSSIQEYPPDVQRKLARVLRYERYGPQRVILKQGHRPMAVYFIYSGSVLVNENEMDWKTNTYFNLTVHVMLAGDCFGERALLCGETRQATVISKENVELLVADKEDFHSVLETTFRNKVDHMIDYCSKVEMLSPWPMYRLKEINNGAYLYCRYYRSNTLVIPDCVSSTWVAVVRSGSCKVVTQVEVPLDEERRKYRERARGRRRRIIPLPHCSEQSKTVRFSDHPVLPKIPQFRSLVTTRGEEVQRDCGAKNCSKERASEGRVKRLFIEIGTVRARECFGLTTLFPKSNKKLSLVSAGAECILIAKKFLLECPCDMLERLKQMTDSGYPEGKQLASLMYQQWKWEEFRRKVVDETLARNARR